MSVNFQIHDNLGDRRINGQACCRRRTHHKLAQGSLAAGNAKKTRNSVPITQKLSVCPAGRENKFARQYLVKVENTPISPDAWQSTELSIAALRAGLQACCDQTAKETSRVVKWMMAPGASQGNAQDAEKAKACEPSAHQP